MSVIYRNSATPIASLSSSVTCWFSDRHPTDCTARDHVPDHEHWSFSEMDCHRQGWSRQPHWHWRGTGV